MVCSNHNVFFSQWKKDDGSWKPKGTCLWVSEIKKKISSFPKMNPEKKNPIWQGEETYSLWTYINHRVLRRSVRTLASAPEPDLLSRPSFFSHHQLSEDNTPHLEKLRAQARVPCLQYVTCGSSTVPYRCQTLVYPCLQPPRWPDHMPDHATWSDSGHYSSCQYLGIKTEYLLSHLKGPSRIKNK